MDFELTQEQRMLADAAGSFAKKSSKVERFRQLRSTSEHAAIEGLVTLHEAAAPRILTAPGIEWPLLDYDEVALKTAGDILPEWLPKLFEPWLHDPKKVRLLHHEQGLTVSPSLAKVYTNQERHDPADLDRAREIASSTDPIPVGILYRNPEVPCYEDLRGSTLLRTPGLIKRGLEAEFDKFTVWPQQAERETQPAE